MTPTPRDEMKRYKLTSPVGYENEFHDPGIRLESGTKVVLASDHDAAIQQLEAQIADMERINNNIRYELKCFLQQGCT